MTAVNHSIMAPWQHFYDMPANGIIVVMVITGIDELMTPMAMKATLVGVHDGRQAEQYER
jgi:hypothetical protein